MKSLSLKMQSSLKCWKFNLKPFRKFELPNLLSWSSLSPSLSRKGEILNVNISKLIDTIHFVSYLSKTKWWERRRRRRQLLTGRVPGQRLNRNKKKKGWGPRCGQLVRVLAFFSDNPSSRPEAYKSLCLERTKIN